MALPTGVGDALTEALFARTPQLRCVPTPVHTKCAQREQPGESKARYRVLSVAGDCSQGCAARQPTSGTQRYQEGDMGKVVWHITMSVDGYIAGPGDEMDWMGNYELESPVGAEVIEDTGAILAGRRWHDLAIERWQGRHGIYGGQWKGPVFVITHEPPTDPPDPGITFVSDGIDEAIATAREAAAGRDVGILGANTAQQAVAAGLVDEIVIHIVPLLLGAGTRLFGPELERVPLERLYVGQSGDATDFRYRVLR